MCASYEGDLGTAGALMARAQQEIPPQAPPALRANLLLMCASYHAAAGDPQRAQRELAEARPLAGEDRAPVIVGLQAGVLAETGRADEAVALAQQALELADRAGHAGNRAFTRVSLGRALEAKGQRVAAISRYLEAQALYAEMGQLANAANARMHAAQVELEVGDARSALSELQGALETFRYFESGQDETAARCSIGRARFLLGDREAGKRELEEALALSQRTHEHHAAICGRAWLAEALWSGEPQRARALLAEALTLGRERGMALELRRAEEIAARLGR
jgi:tetratricopeptide (TPR) repeat protein